MRKITIFQDEWSGLTRLAFAPMRVVFALEELGEDVVEALLRNGLVVEKAERLSVSEVGARVLRANPPQFGSETRVWLEP